MSMMKKLLAVMLCAVLLTGAATVGTPVSADITTVTDGIRWFPVPSNRQNDDAWEVECVADGCLCQRFNETVEDTGLANYLDTIYTANGGLKLRRTDATVILGDTDYTEYYWPRIRTISLETAPAFDLKNADTLYFDIEAAEGSQWNLSLVFNGLNITLGKHMAAACGVDMGGSYDVPSGRFKGSLNVVDVINAVAADYSDYDNVYAQALKNMKKYFTPQLQFYVVGPVGCTVTIHELYMATAEDTSGENCVFLDMGVLTGLGDAFYGDVTNPDLGDVTLDGVVNLADASRLFYYVNGLLALSQKEMLVADVNEDGNVNLADASRLFYRVNGLL